MPTTSGSSRGILHRLATAVRYGGRRFECPACGGHFRTLLKFRDRENTACPRCGTLERQRFLCLVLSDRPELTAAGARVLHFAPEGTVERFLRRRGVRYLSADLEPGRAMAVMDITDIPAEASSFDLIVCSHVLEHVPDDRRAMGELARVLAPGGAALLQHPIAVQRAQTYEDWSITTPDARKREFTQENHVRVYGRDFEERVRQAGFEVEVFRPEDLLDERGVERYRVAGPWDDTFRGSDVYLARWR